MYVQTAAKWLLLFAWLYVSVPDCYAGKRHKNKSFKLPQYDESLQDSKDNDDDFVEPNRREAISSAIDSSDFDEENDDKRATIPAVPEELNWDWGAFNLHSKVYKDERPVARSIIAKHTIPINRKTIIPLEGIVFAKVKDNHVIKPNLSARFFSSHKNKRLKHRMNTVSRRFDLYPRWYTNSIPTLFGKGFARRYYKPYGSTQSVSGQSRHHILHGHRKRHPVLHSLPLSWITGDNRMQIAQKQDIVEKSEDKPEGIELKGIDDVKAIVDDSAASRGEDQSLIVGLDNNHADVGLEKSKETTLPFLKDIPHEVMSELNPYEYTIVPTGRGGQHGGHHAVGVAHEHRHPVGHALASEHVRLQDPGHSTDLELAHGGWTSYESLPAQHHHRHKLNPCFRNPCLNRGHCHFNGGNFKCQCQKGFSGDICDRTRFSCHPNPCFNGGTCTVLQTGYFCSCLPGFRGRECEGQNPCAANPCQNGGKCTDTADGYYCSCSHGFAGKTCADDAIHGEEIPAEHGDVVVQATGIQNGALAAHVANEQHQIEHELEGIILQEKDANHAGLALAGVHDIPHEIGTHSTTSSLHTPVTLHDAIIATHTPVEHFSSGIASEHLTGGAAIFHELPDTRVTDLAALGTTAIECPLSACLNGGSCVKTATSHICNCPVGIHGTRCDSVKHIYLNEEGDHHDVTGTHDIPGAPEHITVPHDAVVDVNALPTPHDIPVEHPLTGIPDATLTTALSAATTCPPDACKNGGACTIAAPPATGHVCNCPAGFHGTDCGSPDLCIPNPCENGATCVQEGDENYKCLCQPGYKGLDCNAQNHCTSQPCKNGGVCEETPDSFHCKCLDGFKGRDCEVLSPCMGNPCLHKGTCIEKGTTYTCQCTDGYKGNKCHLKDACLPNPCINGICHDDGGIAVCNCTHGWIGHNCDAPDYCANSPCMNGGTCEHSENNYRCICPAGLHGINCELQDPCHSNPCENNGRCEQASGTYVCRCGAGFHGETCQLKAHCLPSPCNGHGECFESDEGFICECNPRFMGKFCGVMRYCYDNPCDNGGHCIESDNTYHCVCPFGFKGKNCRVNVCDSHPCLNGGTCIPAENDNGYGCECVFPYHGATCAEMDPCLTNPCKNNGICQSQLQSLHDMHHGSVSVFGPFVDCVPGTDRTHHNGCFGSDAPNVEKENRADNQPPSAYEENEADHDFKSKAEAPYREDKEDKDTDKDSEKTGRSDSSSSKGSDSSSDGAGNESDKGGSSNSIDSSKDTDKKDSANSRWTEGGKDDWPVEAKNDHADLLDKVDYYPKSKPDEGASEQKLPLCSCDHVPSCAWPPQCQPQGCTPPCRRDYEEHGFDHDRHDDTYHRPDDSVSARARSYQSYQKRSLKSPHNYSQVIFFARRNSKDIHHKLEKRSGTGSIFEKRYIGGYHVASRRNKTLQKKDRINKNNDITKLSVREILALKRNKIIEGKADKRLEIIPRVIINYRHAGKNVVYRRTMHELYVCQCTPGYLGAHCQHMNPCRASPCTNGGSCIPRGDHYICQCLAGFGGRHCDDPHPCQPNPCTHNGRCHLAKTVRGYECKCKTGWRGFNCEDRDNCALGNPCRHDGTCLNVDGAEGGVECKCRTRYSGKHCEIDACAACDINAYCHHGNCVCESGYFGNGFRCKAMTDICTPNPCDNKGECRPGIDGKLFSCECQSGYVGVRCELPHPCANSPCLHNGACVDESNSKDRGILLLDRNDYKCFCPVGFKGKNCGETSLAACSSGPCMNNGTCFDSSSESHSKHLVRSEDYECFCDLGYTGKNCQINHFACYSYPCMNGGTCLDAENLPDINFDAHGYKCNCLHGFTGRNCEVTVYGPGSCHQSPCLNNGRCLDAMNSNDPDIHFDYEHQFKCICPSQYSGRICEIPYPACFSRPCHHKGVCTDRNKDPTANFDESGYQCTCMAGYDGKNCERQNSLAIAEEVETDHHDPAMEPKADGKIDEDIHEDARAELKIKDEDERWRNDRRCGSEYFVNGIPAECDSDSLFPCCSDTGWCGNTKIHCDCEGCVDYRVPRYDITPTSTLEPTTVPIPTTTPPHHTPSTTPATAITMTTTVTTRRPKPHPLNEHINLVPPETLRLIQQDRLVTTLAEMKKEYTVKFEVFPTKIEHGWRNVIHLTTGGDREESGSRVPAVWFHQSGKGNLYICAPINYNPNYCYTSSKKIHAKEWVKIQVSQHKYASGYFFKIELNGKEVLKVKNTQPKDYVDVKVFASDKWYPPQPGYIRGLYILPGATAKDTVKERDKEATPKLNEAEKKKLLFGNYFFNPYKDYDHRHVQADEDDWNADDDGGIEPGGLTELKWNKLKSEKED